MTNQDEIQFLSKILFDKYGALALTTEQTAKATNQSIQQLKLDRMHSTGLPYVKAVRHVKYAVTDIAKWILDNRKVVGA